MTHPTRRSFPLAPEANRALLLRAHPLRDSFNSALADAWLDGAREGGLDVRELDLAEMDFDPVLRLAHRGEQPLEADLMTFQRALAAASHVVVAYPVWWGSTPAKLKGLFDRALLPGWAYASGDGAFPDKGLAGRTGRLIVTMDAPSWFDRLAYGRSARRQVRDATFRFTGISPTRVSTFAGIEKTSAKRRQKMLETARSHGRRDARAVLSDLPVDRPGRDAQELGGELLVSLGGGQGLTDDRALDLIE